MRINTKPISIVSAILSGIVSLFSVFAFWALGYLPPGVATIFTIIIYPVFYPVNFILTSVYERGDPVAEQIGTFFGSYMSILLFFVWFLILYVLACLYHLVFRSNSSAVNAEQFVGKIYVSKWKSQSAFFLYCFLFVLILASPVLIMRYQQERNTDAHEEQSTLETPEHMQLRKNYAKTYEGEYVNIPEVGVKFKVPKSLTGFKYSVLESNSERTVVGFSTEALSQYSGCKTSDVALGALYMYPKGSYDQILHDASFVPYIIQIPDDKKLYGGYHANYPYRFGETWYFYSSPTLKYNTDRNAPGSVPNSSGYGSTVNTCTTDIVGATMQVRNFEILSPALSTTFPISENVGE